MQAKMALRGPVVVTGDPRSCTFARLTNCNQILRYWRAGASGFIATQLISQLLQKGYEVRPCAS